MQVFIGAAIPKFIYSLRGFEQPPFHAAKVRNVSSVGSQRDRCYLADCALFVIVILRLSRIRRTS